MRMSEKVILINGRFFQFKKFRLKMFEVIHCDSSYTEVKGSAVMFHGTEGFRWATAISHHRQEK